MIELYHLNSKKSMLKQYVFARALQGCYFVGSDEGAVA